MKKKTLIITLSFLSIFTVIGCCLYHFSNTSNPWNAKTIGDIPAPAGYSRVEAKAGSYADFMRRMPLKEKGAKIELFTGGNANSQFLGTAVIDNTLLSNAEQCADVTIRLRAAANMSCATTTHSKTHGSSSMRTMKYS